jgi:carboxyl-terminal processing protease
MLFRFTLAFILGLTMLLAQADEKLTPVAAVADAKPPLKVASKDGVSLEDIRLFTTVFNLVKQAYVEPVDDKTLMQAAIHGLLAGLDPHSEYLESKAMEELSEDTNGAYVGLGVEVMASEGALRVIAPIDDTPAARAGIKPGDTIVRVDGKLVTAENASQAVDMLRGKAGTEIVLSVLHEGASAPLEIKLVRETIRVASVRGRMLDPGYMYLRVAQFQSDTGAELKRIVAQLKQKNGMPRGAILDLRSNPGGLLTAAVEISDAFLDDGVIVTTKGRLKEADLSFSATPGDVLAGAPLVVLVDNGTASAAEIVSGALKDHGRALIMGRRTFGKGSVQTVLPLDESHAVKLTTARYYTPNGTSIQGTGIAPDIELADLKLTARNAPAALISGERDLPRHLKGDQEKPDVAKPGDAAQAARDQLDDYALGEALNVLKSMAFQRKPAVPAAAATSEKKG